MFSFGFSYILFYFLNPYIVSFIYPYPVKFSSFCVYLPCPNVFHLCWLPHLCLISLSLYIVSFPFVFVFVSWSVLFLGSVLFLVIIS